MEDTGSDDNMKESNKLSTNTSLDTESSNSNPCNEVGKKASSSKNSKSQSEKCAISSSENLETPANLTNVQSVGLPKAVSELEITELERIRETLRQQLYQRIDDLTDSDDENDNLETLPEFADIELETDEKLCPLAATSKEKIPEEHSQCSMSPKNEWNAILDSQLQLSTVSNNDLSTAKNVSPIMLEFGKCPFEKHHFSKPKSPISEKQQPSSIEGRTNISKSKENAEVLLENNELSTLDIQDTDLSEPSVTGDKISPSRSPIATYNPPLVMHSFNLLLNDGLDNKHGGGGIETTNLKANDFAPPRKKLKLYSSLEDGTSQTNGICQLTVYSDDDSAMPGESFEDDISSNQIGDMEFDILDEFESDGNDDQNDANSSSDSSSDAMDYDEIDALLDEKLKNSKALDPNNPLAHEEKQKVVLKVKGKDHFDVLPEGWIEVTHNCGMPIYLHKQTRVCSMSKPYFLGPGSTRKHKIPVSAIPCLHYLKQTEKEKQKADNEANENAVNAKEDASNTPNPTTENPPDPANKNNGIELTATNGMFPSAKLQSAKDTKESGSLDFLAIRRYCEKRFEFQRITVKRFSTWSGRRKHQKKMKQDQRPFLPDDTKLITCRPVSANVSEKSTVTGSTGTGKREFIMNPSGKSPVCILHEYVQHTLRLQPKYEFKELENAKTPYGAVVVIDGIKYGNGFGSSKKLAKSDAARAALAILIPNMKLHSKQEHREAQDVEFFDQVRVEDPRVSDLSVKAGQPYPYQILLECLKRNYGMGDTAITFVMKNIKHQKNEFSMKVGKHEVSVVCKNKRDGKHRASQAILQKLHPHISSWGSLLRMYGKGSCKTLKEKKEEEQRITELQSKACANKPNTSILSKLKEEMMKYREKVESKKPIGKLIPDRMECLTTSSSNLKNLEL